MGEHTQRFAWSFNFVYLIEGNSCAGMRGFFCPYPKTECASSDCLCLEKGVAYMGNNINEVSQLNSLKFIYFVIEIINQNF